MAQITTGLMHSGDGVRERVEDQLNELKLLWNNSLMLKLWKISTDLTPVRKWDLVLLAFSTNSKRARTREAWVHSWHHVLPFRDQGGRCWVIRLAPVLSCNFTWDWMLFRLSFCSSTTYQCIKYQQKICWYSGLF